MTATVSARQHTSLPYRPAIDGLRAFAVLSVICFHLLPASMPGGWFGVDVFFVISGFLITALLLAEYRRERGHIDLVGFWFARARRLLPALFLVLAAVLVGATFLTVSGRTGNVAGDVLATLGYVANWRFVLGDEAYFGQVASPSPLRHAWSLAVEEQFYLAYPVLLIGLLALIRRRATLVAVLVVASAASAVLMAHLHHPGLDPSRVYYGTDTRAHQLLVGAAVAAVISGGPGAIDREKVRILDMWCRRLALPALLVVVSTFWWAGPAQDAIFEGLAVPLSLTVCVVLVAATSPTPSRARRLLSWEPLRRIGMVSYGLYLWHWPIIIFLNDQVLPTPTAPRVALQAGLTALLTWLSYRYVERPVRRGGIRALVPRLPRASAVVAWAAVPALVVGAVTMPAAARTVATTTASAGELTIPQPAYRPTGEMISVTFVGNSVPRSLITYFTSSNHPDIRLHDTTNIGCDPLAAPKFSDGKVQPEQDGCSAWRAGLGEEIAADDPDVVVWFAAHTMVTDRIVHGRVVEFGSPAWVDLIEDGLDRARSAAGSSEFAVMNVACHEMPTFNSEEIQRVNDPEYVTTLNRTVSAWAEENDVPVLDQYSLLCPGDKYHDTINDVPLYQDSIHFTGESGPVFWRWLAPRLQRISRGQDLS
ncbi:acyltransferase [Janibacter cremeus]|uniref:acyltransferase family protein n=1 Tax=Janibacter cremeus TaxID=1285192 RepID=UPI0023F673C5|nr:acyltransferase [Janibacter cremeus]WEV79219.1 acyltransferase [Janibacter cremeus]